MLDTRNWGGHPSPNTEARAFCSEFADYTGAGYAAACANGSVALTLALQAGRIEPGAEVITTAYTFVATAAAIAQVGCVPVFVDVLPGTYCLDPDQVAATVGPRTQAIIPVHLACGLADMDRLCEISRRHSLLLIEDCAHAHGARWRDRGAGSLGDLGCFSMQSTKLLTAGEGGAVTTNDPAYAQRLQSLVNCGRKEPGYDGFPERMLGHNLRMTEWQAAILREQLRRLPGQHERRERSLARFVAKIADLPGLRPLERDPRITRRAVYQFVLRFDPQAFAGVTRDRAIAALRAEGVPCSGRFYVPVNEDPLFAMDPRTNPAARSGADYTSNSFPVARRAAYEESVWLPHELFLGGDEDIDDLVDAFTKLRENAAALR